MITYWVIVALYVFSFFVCMDCAALLSKSDKSSSRIEPSSSFAQLFLGAIFAWLLVATFCGNWTPVAILITIIWATNWIHHRIRCSKGYTVTVSTYVKAMFICLVQFILLMIYGWGF